MRHRSLSRSRFVAVALASVLLPASAFAQSSSADITAFQKPFLSKLAGAAEIEPGLTLANRATIENRQAARAFLLATLKSIGLEGQRHPYGDAGGENIYAVLPSTTGNPDAETVLLGAHYDSVVRGPGANDDGTGVAAVMAAARDLAALKVRTRTLIVAFFDEEERGLRGSRAFATKMKDDRVNLVAVHTVDQVGWDENRNGAVEIELPYDGAAALYESASKRLGLNVPTFVTEEAGSDHSAFRREGFKAVGVTEEYRHQDTTPHIHKATDTVDTVNFDYLASCTRLVRAVIQDLISAQ